MRGYLAVAMVTIGAGACAPTQPPQMGWYKAGASNAEFQRDSYGCMNEAARTFPAVAGVEGISDEEGGIISSYDINGRNRNDAASACMRIRGWQLVPQTAQSYAPSAQAAQPVSPTTADPILTCKANMSKASPTAAPTPINGGVVRIQVGRDVITVTSAKSAANYRVEGTHDGMLVGSTRGADGSQWYVHVSVAERAFVMMHVVNGQPKEALTGPCT